MTFLFWSDAPAAVFLVTAGLMLSSASERSSMFQVRASISCLFLSSAFVATFFKAASNSLSWRETP